MRLRSLTVALSLLVVVHAAEGAPITFDVGLPTSITLVVGTPTPIPAAIINTSPDPLVFGCARMVCGGLHPHAPFGIPLSDDPFLSYVQGPSGSGSYEDQFVGLVLAPNERFDFTIFSFTLEATPPAPLAPFFQFLLQDGSNHVSSPFVQPPIIAGDTTVISPLVFHSAPAPAIAPEPAAIGLLILAGGAYWRRRWRH